MKHRLSLLAFGSTGLLLGAAIGPTVAQAGTAGLLRLEGGGSHHIAKVSSQGQLSVTDGTAHTKAHQIEATVASPAQAVAILSHVNPCAPGGFYKVPKGKALIITGVVFFNHPNTSTSFAEQDLLMGPASSPCTTLITAGISQGTSESLPQTFNPGVPVPNGDAIGEESTNDPGVVMVYGYLVPAAAVPHPRTPPQPRLGRNGSITLRH